jgi:hypothetical protein
LTRLVKLFVSLQYTFAFAYLLSLSISHYVISSFLLIHPGYLPAEEFPLYPFMALRMAIYIIAFAIYLYYSVSNKGEALPLHSGFLVLFVTALAEAVLWFAAYYYSK